VFADIGDHQSIAESLSTFSAHVFTVNRILQEADDGSLVLLDEVGAGTDPFEGAALAGAVLLALTARGALTIATTHLSQLKDLAAAREGFLNASLQFDGETLAPTYRFLLGQPGRSYGIAIAKRLGFPADVLGTAEELVPEGARSLEAALAELGPRCVVGRRPSRLRRLRLRRRRRRYDARAWTSRAGRSRSAPGSGSRSGKDDSRRGDSCSRRVVVWRRPLESPERPSMKRRRKRQDGWSRRACGRKGRRSRSWKGRAGA
jgi:DNA mismatch repair protein MutS2